MDSLPERNPVTHQIHRREVFRQITIPMLFGALVLIGLCAQMAFFVPAEGQSLWADISLIWLIIPTMFFGLVIFLLLGATAYAIIALVRKLPTWTLRLQNGIAMIGVAARRLDDRLVEPVLRVQGWQASWRTLKHSLWRNLGRK